MSGVLYYAPLSAGLTFRGNDHGSTLIFYGWPFAGRSQFHSRFTSTAAGATRGGSPVAAACCVGRLHAGRGMNADPNELASAFRMVMWLSFLGGLCCWQCGRVLAVGIVYALGWRVRRRRWARWMIERAREPGRLA